MDLSRRSLPDSPADGMVPDVAGSQERPALGDDFVGVVRRNMDEQLAEERNLRREEIQQTEIRVAEKHAQLQHCLEQRIKALEQRQASLETRLVTSCTVAAQ